jgi:hypothetical protein
MSKDGQKELDTAFRRLERETPDYVTRAIRWLRDPAARKVRIPLGVALIIASGLWFLPVLGIEMLPLGLLLIAQDVPFLKKPVGRAMLWLEDRWCDLRAWWKGSRSGAGGCAPTDS